MELTHALLTAVMTAGAVYGVIKTELYFLRRDIDKAHQRLDDWDKQRYYHLQKANKRVGEYDNG